MGFMTFEDMRTEVSMNLGALSPSPSRLGLWVNFGYLNLCSYVKLEELVTVANFPIVSGQSLYNAPQDILGIECIDIFDASDPKKDHRRLAEMKWTPKATDPRQPVGFRRRGSVIEVWPVPDKGYGGSLTYYRTPTPLSSPGDVTVLSPIWDVAIVMLGTYHGFLALGRGTDSDRWLARFLGYVGSRIKHVDVAADAPKGGISVAWNWDDIARDPPQFEE